MSMSFTYIFFFGAVDPHLHICGIFAASDTLSYDAASTLKQ